MSKLARIKDVSFYVGLTEAAQSCWEMKKFLGDSGIDYQLLAYMDDSVHEHNFKALSAWSWGPEGETREFTSFPVLTWKEFNEDFNEVLQYATTVEEVRAKLLPNKALIRN